MKIGFFINSIYSAGGTRKVLTMISNELAKDHEVYIISLYSRKEEAKDYYGLSDKVKVRLVDSSLMITDLTWQEARARKHARKIKDCCNIQTESEIQEYMRSYMPDTEAKAWGRYFNRLGLDILIAVGGLIMNLGRISEYTRAHTMGWAHSTYDGYFEKMNTLYWHKEKIAQVYFNKHEEVIVLNPYDQEAFDSHIGTHTMVINNPRSFTSEIKTDVVHNKNFLIAARLVSQKGVDLAIRSFAEFCKYDDEWNLIIAGDGKDRKKLIDLIWKLKIQERVKMVGMTDNVIKYYLQSSVYLLPSRVEGWGLVIVEAFEMGMPVIAYDVGPTDLIITNGENGIIIEPYDYVKYGAAMYLLARNTQLRKQMAEKAVKEPEKYSIEKIAANWNQLLDHYKTPKHQPSSNGEETEACREWDADLDRELAALERDYLINNGFISAQEENEQETVD